MDINTFLIECEMRGIRIMADGENLRVKGSLKPATADYIRKHKAAILKLLNSEHGACHKCGADTRSMITKPDGSFIWICSQCIDADHERAARTSQRRTMPRRKRA